MGLAACFATSIHPVTQTLGLPRRNSDAFDVYEWLWYHGGTYQVSQGKADAYSVEGDNAELRHYLARLARRSRYFHVARKL